MTDFRQQWQQDWAALKLTGEDTWLARLLGSYGAAGRHYHTLQHLAECLDLLGQVAHLAEHPGEVAIALWFHDAVHVPLASDNEERSATWACAALNAAGASADTIERVHALIMATAHRHAPIGGDGALVVDIDLAILGAAPARFAQYEQQVRAEYAAVPIDVYRQKRGALLARFLARPALFATPALQARYEAPARSNLQQAIGKA